MLVHEVGHYYHEQQVISETFVSITTPFNAIGLILQVLISLQIARTVSKVKCIFPC